jgi:FPC/CPF motif-containing protein YcgG
MFFEKRNKRRARPWNPMARENLALAQSSYHRSMGSKLMRLFPDFSPASPEATRVNAELHDIILGEGYPCIGSRSAVNSSTYRLGVYGELGSKNTALGLCHDLYEFSREFQEYGKKFVSMITCYRSPNISSELDFENLLWKQLQQIHEIDSRYFDWDEKVSSNPADDTFSLSVGGRAFFVVGMHPLASRRARQFPFICLVFNLHEQFDRLRARGKFETMKRLIRARDQGYSGSVNPMVSDHGSTSEARQYSGRKVSDDWKCPFERIDRKSEDEQ